MKKTFIESICWKGVYMVCPGTKASFYAEALAVNFELANASERKKANQETIKKLVQSGEYWLLPHRIGVLVGTEMASSSGSGRAGKRMDAQLKGAFTVLEVSPYKQHKPFEVQTGLWRVEGERTLYYGTLGITGTEGKIIQDNGDLLLLRTTDWRRLEIFIFKGLAGLNKQLDNLPEVVEYVKGV